MDFNDKFSYKHFQKNFFKKIKGTIIDKFLSKFFKTILVVLVILFALNTTGLSNIATGILTAVRASALIFGFAFKEIG